MKKVAYNIFLNLLAMGSSSIFAMNQMHAQLTVWNMTKQDVMLNCQLLQPDATMLPAQKIKIVSGQSPAFELTFYQLGKLVYCAMQDTPAWFIYTVKANDEESVEIAALQHLPNFHYDPVYKGALTYY